MLTQENQIVSESCFEDPTRTFLANFVCCDVENLLGRLQTGIFPPKHVFLFRQFSASYRMLYHAYGSKSKTSFGVMTQQPCNSVWIYFIDVFYAISL